MPKRVAVGVVTSDKTAKTRRVEIPAAGASTRKYGKYLRRKTVCYVHDENNESHAGRHGGDRRVPAACRRTKRWALVRVVSKSRLVDVAAMRAAAAGQARSSAGEAEA